MKPYILIFLIIHFQSALSQKIVSRILDKDTKLPVPFATIKVLNTNRGEIASETGTFEMVVYSKDSIQVSSIGYKNITLWGDELEKEIFISKKNDTLKPIVVYSKTAIKSVQLGNIDNSLHGDLNWGTADAKEEFAQKIILPDSTASYLIKTVDVPVKKWECWGDLLLHVYAPDSATGLPGEETYMQYVKVTKKQVHNNKLTIDLKPAKLIISQNSFFFISVGWPPDTREENCQTTLMLTKSVIAPNTYSRTLVSPTYKWFLFGENMKDKSNNPFKSGCFYSIEADELK